MSPAELFISFTAFLGASLFLAPFFARLAQLFACRKARDVKTVLALRAALRGWNPVEQKHAREKE